MNASASSVPYAAVPRDGISLPANSTEANASGVSWPAVFAGSAVAAALALILLALGTGLGLSSISMWSSVGATTGIIGASAIIWLIVMEIISSAMGGYLAGRLRTKWTSIHNDEVYFRDTAHGFLAWAVSLIVTAAFLGSAGATFMGQSSPSANTNGSGQMASHGVAFDPNAYYLALMFQGDGSKPEAQNASARTDASVIIANAIRMKSLPKEDQRYLGQLVASQTGLNESDAEARVSVDFTWARQAVETTRKAVAHALLWTFLALLIGAFSASLAATLGGRQRDHVVVLP
jgi:hypothetical protein